MGSSIIRSGVRSEGLHGKLENPESLLVIITIVTYILSVSKLFSSLFSFPLHSGLPGTYILLSKVATETKLSILPIIHEVYIKYNTNLVGRATPSLLERDRDV